MFPVNHTPLTPLSFLSRSAEVYAHKTAVVYGDRRFSYLEFYHRVNRLTSALKQAGHRPGDRVAFLCPNTPPMLEAHFGVLQARGVLVSINIRLSPREIAYILNHSGAKFLFVDTEFGKLVEPVLSELDEDLQFINIVDKQEFELVLPGDEYEGFLRSGSSEAHELPQDLDEQETICINYTSGTTGKPKGVMYTHRGAYLNALSESHVSQYNSQSVFLWTLPMFHCNGWCSTWGITAQGATHVCLRKFDPGVVWQLIRNEQVTHLNGPPVMQIAMLNHPDCPTKLSGPLTVTTAGAPPSPTLIEKLSALGAEVIHVYGLTETYGPHTVCIVKPEWAAHGQEELFLMRARQGVAMVGADLVRVVDEQMNDVPRDGETMGEVVMRGNNVMKGYYNNPTATAEAFRGGWFHSGDLAVWHPDGYIQLRDRSKDVIITGGENVSSIEVEQALYKNPIVLECAVVGIPHDKWGETPKAFVTLKEGIAASEQDIIEHCRNQIAHYKCPTTVQFGPLPKTSTGKIQKFKLRDKEWQGAAVKIQG